jgi:hypothetical protein
MPTLPVLVTVKSVVVAKVEVEDAITNSVLGEMPTVDEAAKMERKAAGEVVPMPSKPAEVMVVVPV